MLCCTFARNPKPLFTGLRSLVSILPVAAAPTGLLSWLLLGRFSTEALRSAFAQALAQVSPDALRARLRSVLGIDVTDQLRATTVPILYLRATRDWVVASTSSQLVTRLKPSVRVVQVEAPHFLLQAAPVEAARVVGDFMREVQGGVAGSS